MANINLYPFSTKTKGEGNIGVNNMLNIDFEMIRQIINIQDSLITELEAE